MGLFDRLFSRRPPDEPEPRVEVSAQSLNAEDLLVMHGREVPAALERLRAESRETGLIPAVLGEESAISRILDVLQVATEDSGLTPAQALKAGIELDTEAWLLRAATDFEEDAAVDPELRNSVGKWPLRTPSHEGLITHRDALSRRFLEQVYVGLFRAEQSWEVFAPLLWSANNYDMGPDIHVAMHKRWQSL